MIDSTPFFMILFFVVHQCRRVDGWMDGWMDASVLGRYRVSFLVSPNKMRDLARTAREEFPFGLIISASFIGSKRHSNDRHLCIISRQNRGILRLISRRELVHSLRAEFCNRVDPFYIGRVKRSPERAPFNRPKFIHVIHESLK